MPQNPRDDQPGPGGRDDGPFRLGPFAHAGPRYGNRNAGDDNDDPGKHKTNWKSTHDGCREGNEERSASCQ